MSWVFRRLASASARSYSRSVWRSLQISPPRRTPPECAYFRMPLAMLLAAYSAIISPDMTMDFLRLVLADRHGETAADHVAEHVVGDVVDIVIGAVFFKEVDGGDNAAAGAAHARLRTTGLDALDVLVADLEHVIELEVFNRTGFGGQAQHGVLQLGVEDQAGRVGLWVAANDQDLLAKVDQGSERVLRGGGFADAALAVESDLTKFAHVVVLFAMM